MEDFVLIYSLLCYKPNAMKYPINLKVWQRSNNIVYSNFICFSLHNSGIFKVLLFHGQS